MHCFVFEDNEPAAEWNKKILVENDNNYEKAVRAQPNSSIIPGLEFLPIAVLEKLLRHRDDWPEIQKIISGGCNHPLEAPRDDNIRLKDV